MHFKNYWIDDLLIAHFQCLYVHVQSWRSGVETGKEKNLCEIKVITAKGCVSIHSWKLYKVVSNLQKECNRDEAFLNLKSNLFR